MQWRFPLGFKALQMFLLFIGIFWLPKSPRHLIENDYDEGVLRVQKRSDYDGTNEGWIQIEFAEIKYTFKTEQAVTEPG